MKGENDTEKLGVDGRIILEWILWGIGWEDVN
jgi:hypothetical protein